MRMVYFGLWWWRLCWLLAVGWGIFSGNMYAFGWSRPLEVLMELLAVSTVAFGLWTAALLTAFDD
jgi:hypothetical protein